MTSLAPSYTDRRAWIEQYFDQHAAEAWARLTSEAPVSGIRAKVRAGRDRTRATLAGWLPADLTGRRILDAGCGTGQLALELARRGADVVGVDLSRTLTDLARERAAAVGTGPGRVTFLAGDMLDPALGEFDHVVAMDSIIHYDAPDAVAVLAALAPRVRRSMAFTFAPRTPLLAVMHFAGGLLPGRDRAPRIVPVREAAVRRAVLVSPQFREWRAARHLRIHAAFYTTHALELVK